MLKDVVISIKGSQGLDGEKDIIELTTEGRMGIKEDEFLLTYKEGQLLDSGEDVETKLFIRRDGSAVLQRSGSLNSRMEIMVGKRNICYYSTPIGDIVIGITGEEVRCNLTESGGEVDLVYTIDSDLRLISENKVNIIVSEV